MKGDLANANERCILKIYAVKGNIRKGDKDGLIKHNERKCDKFRGNSAHVSFILQMM